MSRHFLLLWFLPVASAQIYLNLGFEGGSGSHPVNWIRSGLEYDIQEDPTVAYAGLQSMRIRNVVFPPQFPGVFRQHFPVEEARGKHLRFSGYLKTEGVTSKPAGLYMTIYGDNGRSILSNDSTSKGAPQGTSNWLQVVIDRDVSPLAEIIDFGATLGGNGTAYFDELKIEIDGVPYPQGADALGRPPTMEETGWLPRTR